MMRVPAPDTVRTLPAVEIAALLEPLAGLRNCVSIRDRWSAMLR